MKWLPHQQTGTARDAIRRMREQYPGESPPEKVAEWTAWYEERGGLEGNGNG
ncbi:MAG: hypothetical protein GY851_19280 [bacterium]|nr:hypothetical protein [bacterium]